MEFNPFLLFKANEIVIFLPKLLFVIDFVRGLKQIALICKVCNRCILGNNIFSVIGW